jgi:putative radical SAM enzyme (TIGR03279 family)
MHISPINISVHTTNPDLRVKMMTNKNAGNVLSIINRFNDAGIKINCQMVLCPSYNDGKELERTLEDLTNLKNAECIAAVPVGLTKYRDGLAKLTPFNKQTAGETIDIINRFGDKCMEKYSSRRVYASDEFYLLAEREMPKADYYGDFLQLDNGVGMWSLLEKEADDAIDDCDYKLEAPRSVSLITGEAAYPLITQIVDKMGKKWDNLNCKVYKIRNDFFGPLITVAGLVTATDIISQLENQDLGDEVIIPDVMLRSEKDMFLDSITVSKLSEKLGVKITVTAVDGYDMVENILGGAVWQNL